MCKHREVYRITTDIFIQRAIKLHGNKYDYTSCKYINKRTKVTIGCPIHGKYEQNPLDHLKGTGCRKCGRIITTQKVSYPIEYKAELSSWRSMIRRCYMVNENSVSWKYYKGRGITVCDRWRDKKQGFYSFITDMGKIPIKGYTLDRIDVNGNYEPSNCRWASGSEQVINSRRKVNKNSLIHNVTKTKQGRWKVELEREGKTYYAGTFSTIDEAATAKENLLKKIKDEMYNNK